MKTTLVNHGGIVQSKFIIRTDEELLQYRDITAKIHGNALVDLTDNPNKIREAMELISQVNKTSMLDSAIYMTNQKILAMHNRLLQGYILVANMSGGWTIWDDKEMKLVTGQSIKKSKSDNYENCIEYNIGTWKTLVLENQVSISDRVLSYLKETGTGEYSFISNIQFDHDGELPSLIESALKSGCNTIMAETTLQNERQILELVSLFEILPPITMILFLCSADLKDTLFRLIGEDRTEKLYQKHEITVL